MNRTLLILLVGFLHFNTFSQTLNIPQRDVNALEGSEVVNAITSLSLQDRELYIKNEVLTGNIPDFQRNLIAVTDSAFISGTYKYITYYVIPDYLALGSDTNYFLCPMTPILAQQLADSLDCLLPSQKMVDAIWAHASVKMNPESIPPSPAMTTVPVFDDHNTMVKTQRDNFVEPLGTLVAGNKKDVIISNLIYTSPPPARVVIYGWHYPNGNNIQPVYAGHIDTYADYSHGIRMVQNQCWVDGVPMLASQVLADANLHPLLSDEGAMSLPFYPDTSGTTVPNPPQTPLSFSVTNESVNSIRIQIDPDPNTDSYNLYSSLDGLAFSLNGSYTSNDIVLSGLSSDQPLYIKLSATNSGGTSNQSEVLAAVPTSAIDSVLIVNGFDRLSTGNSKDFIKQHGTAIHNYGSAFSSATNDAIESGLVDLSNYRVVDYILGEESTVDETFNDAEQLLIKDYLDQGGMLYVSGAEVGWDLDYLGSASDQDFYANYLKAQYVMDAPDDVASIFYHFNAVNDTVFYGLDSTSFDNGTNGTYNVDYPDVISAVNGSVNGLYYSNDINQFAGVYFEGVFPGGSDKGKLVYMGVPFETIYPESSRNQLMQQVMEFFEDEVVISDSTAAKISSSQSDIKIYPNPFNHELCIVLTNHADVRVINSLKQTVFEDHLSAGKQTISTNDFTAGIYIIQIQGENFTIVEKLIKR